jgi:hypothetical protein
MTNQEKFIQIFGIDTWKQMVVFTGLADQFKEYWTSPYEESEEDIMNEVGIEIIKTEENEKSGKKYLNINVSNSEVERNPDIVRLCSDVGILEYVKLKTDD